MNLPETPRRPVQASVSAPRVLAVLDGKRGTAQVIEAARTLAQDHGSPWMAVLVESRVGVLHSSRQETAIQEYGRQAQEQGADVVHLEPTELHAVQDILAQARAWGATILVVGRRDAPRWRSRRSHALLENLLHQAEGLQVLVVPLASSGARITPSQTHPRRPGRLQGAVALGFVGAATLIGFLVGQFLDLADIVMVYILAITISAARFGRPTAMLVSILSVLALDFFFVPPRFSLAVTDVRHLGTFAVMLGLGWIVANLAERTRAQARVAQERERYTSALNRLGAVLGEGGSRTSLCQRVESFLAAELEMPAHLVLCGPSGLLPPQHLLAAGVEPEALPIFQDPAALLESFQASLAIPLAMGLRGRLLIGSGHLLGLLVLTDARAEGPTSLDRDRMIPAFATQIAGALERAQLAEERTEARIKADHERLRNTLLSSISHDLRTPLSTIAGAATTLMDPGPEIGPGGQRVLVQSIHQEAWRLQRLVSNVLELTRLESGQVVVRKEWVPLEEIVGTALARMEDVLRGRTVTTAIEDVWIPVDPILFEQVLLNLLENACKFSPAGSPIDIECQEDGTQATLQVLDRGPGIPAEERDAVFDKLFRGRTSGGIPGAGLGLAICRAVVQAHRGTIHVDTPPGGGARFRVVLPTDGPRPEILTHLPGMTPP